MKAYQEKPIDQLNPYEMAEYYEDNGQPILAQMIRQQADRARLTIQPPFIIKKV